MLNIGTLLHSKIENESVKNAIKVFQYYRPVDKLDESCFEDENFKTRLMLELDNLVVGYDYEDIIKIVSKILIDIQYTEEKDIFTIYDELNKRGLSMRVKDGLGISAWGD